MKLILCILFSFFSIFLKSAEIKGHVIKVYDGDTFKFKDADGGKYKVRLADVDAPEKDQPFGIESKIFLTLLILDKPVVVKFKSIDMYGRIVGSVKVDCEFLDLKFNSINEVTVNEMMVKMGLAWWYAQYSDKPKYKELQDYAKSKSMGLWKDENPVPPWNWRKM